MKVALYFGSFNPVHSGHVKLAEYLIDNKIVDEVWFVVSPCNPLKKQEELIDEFLRLDMLILAIQGKPHLKASDMEFTMPVPSYTYQSLSKFSKDYPEYQFSLIIGSDNAHVFNKWKNYNEILKEYEVLVYPRKEYDFELVAKIYPQMKLLNTPFYEISSTEIRNAIQEKKDLTKWLDPSVYQFIIENKLYQDLAIKRD